MAENGISLAQKNYIINLSPPHEISLKMNNDKSIHWDLDFFCLNIFFPPLIT